MKFRRESIKKLRDIGAILKFLTVKNMQYLLKLRFCVHLLYLVVLLGCVVGLALVCLCVFDEKVTNQRTSHGSDNFTTVKQKITNNLSCYYTNDEDVSKADEKFSPLNDKSIFFFGTSCSGNLSMLQACAVESAARSHATWYIYVLFSSGVINIASKSFLGELLQYRNVKVARIPIHEYLNDARLESVLINDLKKTLRPEDFSNIVRIVILNKWGGIFIEDDMLVFRSFESLPRNWVANQDNGVSSRILAFANDEVGRNITSKIIEEISKTYDSESEQYNLSKTITRVLERMCPEVFLSNDIITCEGVTVFSRDLFYPIKYSSKIFYIDDSDVDVGTLKVPYTYHHLLKLADFNSFEDNDDQQIYNLASKFCPYIYYRFIYTEVDDYNIS